MTCNIIIWLHWLVLVILYALQDGMTWCFCSFFFTNKLRETWLNEENPLELVLWNKVGWLVLTSHIKLILLCNFFYFLLLGHISNAGIPSQLFVSWLQGQVSSLFWLLHSDLHETRATAALEYMSSMKATLEQMAQPMDGQRGNSESLSLTEHNLRRGKFSVHVKRRNGRVRKMVLLPPHIAASVFLHLFRIPIWFYLRYLNTCNH